MTAGLVWGLVAVVLGAGTLVAVAARSLRDFSRYELEELCLKRNTPELLGDIVRHHDHALSGLESLRWVLSAVAVAGAVCGGWIELSVRSAARPSWFSFSAACVAAALTYLAALEWVPRAVVRLWAEPFLWHTWFFWRLIARLMSPFAVAAGLVDTALHFLVGRPAEQHEEEAFEDEIRSIVTEGQHGGLIEEDAREMIEGVMELTDAVVSDIMTPRTDMVSMNLALPWNEVVDFVVNQAHSRIPVYDKNRDDIVGILYARDLLPELAQRGEEPQRPLTEVLRKPHFVPQTKPVVELLQEFQRTRNHMAIVLDEYGGVSGLVTIEDVLEEIVGEIVDEYDDDRTDHILAIDDHTADVLARTPVDEINDQLGVELAGDGDFDTIGGLVFSSLGRIPAKGEELIVGNVKITVLEVTRRRIEKVRIEMLDQLERERA